MGLIDDDYRQNNVNTKLSFAPALFLNTHTCMLVSVVVERRT